MRMVSGNRAETGATVEHIQLRGRADQKTPSFVLTFFCAGSLLCQSLQLGFLYVTYSGESTFGAQ